MFKYAANAYSFIDGLVTQYSYTIFTSSRTQNFCRDQHTWCFPFVIDCVTVSSSTSQVYPTVAIGSQNRKSKTKLKKLLIFGKLTLKCLWRDRRSVEGYLVPEFQLERLRLISWYRQDQWLYQVLWFGLVELRKPVRRLALSNCDAQGQNNQELHFRLEYT